MMMFARKARDPDIKPAWLTDVDVAILLGVHRSTVWTWLESGLIPEPRRVGVAYRGGQRRSRTTRWLRSDLELFVQCKSMDEFIRRRRQQSQQ
jgi:predicted DNA-binding transcriptional regulator AlpA